MNIHLPQTEESVAEVANLANVESCILNAQTNRPIMAIVYDGLSAAYKLTRDDTTVEPDLFNDCIVRMTNQEDVPTLQQRLLRHGMVQTQTVQQRSVRKRVFAPGQEPEPLLSRFERARQELPANTPVTDERFTVIIPAGLDEVDTDAFIEQWQSQLLSRYFSRSIAGQSDLRNNQLGRRTLHVVDLVTKVLPPEVADAIVAQYKDETEEVGSVTDVEVVRSYPGRALFSALLPADFFYRKGDVVILDGILVQGTITKDHIGVAGGSIVQALWKDYNRHARTVDFLTDTPFLLNYWLQQTGLSVGLSDCFPKDESLRKAIAVEINKAKLNVEALGTKLDDPLEEERREADVVQYLNIARDFGAKVSKENLTEDNSINIMTVSGAKGSHANIAQITSMLGQQFVRGKRIPQTLSEGTRCLPYFARNDIDPRSRGFCENSFLTGLTPAEMVFHQAASREGLMDTAIKTAETGDIHHRIIKALENLRTAHDGSVRDSVGNIVQFTALEDGFNAAELEKIKISTSVVEPFKSTEVLSFIDLGRLVGRINASFGFGTREAVGVAASAPEAVDVSPGETFADMDNDFDDGGE